MVGAVGGLRSLRSWRFAGLGWGFARLAVGGICGWGFEFRVLNLNLLLGGCNLPPELTLSRREASGFTCLLYYLI